MFERSTASVVTINHLGFGKNPSLIEFEHTPIQSQLWKKNCIFYSYIVSKEPRAKLCGSNLSNKTKKENKLMILLVFKCSKGWLQVIDYQKSLGFGKFPTVCECVCVQKARTAICSHWAKSKLDFEYGVQVQILWPLATFKGSFSHRLRFLQSPSLN